MNCINCNKEFEAKRIDAKYCSKLCRALGANRNLSATSNTEISATNYAQPELSATQELSATEPEIAQEIVKIATELDSKDAEQLPQDLNIHDFNGDLNQYQSYVHNRNQQTRDRLQRTPLIELKRLGVFIPAWRYIQN